MTKHPPFTGKHQITAPTGDERVYVENGGAMGGTYMSASQIAGLNTKGAAHVYHTNALAASGVLTAEEITGGADSVFLDMSGAFTAAANIQLPPVPSLVAALGAGQGVGSTFKVRVINPNATSALTITPNTGWNFGSGSYVLAYRTFRDFLVTIVSDTAATFQDVGGGAVTAE